MATENRERIRLNIAGGSGPAKKRALAVCLLPFAPSVTLLNTLHALQHG